jgi:hypothetical protein
MGNTYNKDLDLNTLNKGELFSFFKQAISELKHCEELLAEMDVINNQINTLHAKRARAKVNIITLLIMLILEPLGLIYIAYKYINRYPKAKYKEDLSILVQENELNLKRLNDYVDHSETLNLVSGDYSTLQIIETILDYLRSGQAETWGQCKTLIDAQIHRWKLEEHMNGVAPQHGINRGFASNYNEEDTVQNHNDVQAGYTPGWNSGDTSAVTCNCGATISEYDSTCPYCSNNPEWS